MSDINEVEKKINLEDVVEIASNKGKWKNVFVDGYKFTHQKVVKECHYYVCAKYFDSKCSSRLIKKSETDYTLRGDHQHPATASDLPRADTLQTLKETAKTETVNSQVAVVLPTLSQMFCKIVFTFI